MTLLRQALADSATQPRFALIWLGVAGRIGAPMIGLALLLSRFGYIRNTGQADGVLSTIYMGGFLCTATALRLARVTGRGRTGAVISSVQIIGLLLATTWAVLTALGFPPIFKTVSAVTDMAWPFSHVFMFAVGIAAWKAKVWKGWPVVMLLLCGAALPIAMAARVLFGDLGMIIGFAALTTVPLTFTARKISREAGMNAPPREPHLRRSCDFPSNSLP
jgi:hypothetical protein